jgi:hypothetical protein
VRRSGGEQRFAPSASTNLTNLPEPAASPGLTSPQA